MNENEQRKQACSGVFGRAAATYDTIGPQFFAAFGRRLVELADIPISARVLDVATGRGALLFPAAEHVGASGYVNGIDLAEPMVQATNDEIKRRGIANADVRVMDAEQIQFADETFDVVTCGFALFFLPQVQRGLREIRRVLKSGGRVALSTWGDDDKRWAWHYELLKKYLPPRPEPQDTKSSRRFDTPDKMIAHVSEVGFRDARVIGETAAFVYANADTWWQTQWSHGSRSVLEMLSPDALAHFKHDVFAEFAARQLPNGLPRRMSVLFTMATK